MLNSLSGRFLILTVIFVMVAEVLIFVPSVARFREDYLLARLERAQIASLALLADDMIEPELERELLENAGVFNIVLQRDQIRQLMLSSEVPGEVSQTFDLRDAPAVTLMRDAIACLVDAEPQVIRVMGNPLRDGGELIEVTMDSGPLRAAMLDYGVRILLLSAAISIITAGLLFLAVRKLLVKPIKGVVGHIRDYAAAPEDARRIIQPMATVRELREAEESLQSLQSQLTQALRQKERLAQLGGAVARVSHDLRNILTSAQLFTDRIEMSEDPAVQRMAPKLVNSITRAISLCESTLAFGRAEEPAPRLMLFNLAELTGEVLEAERLAIGEADVSLSEDIPVGLMVRGDPEQIYRALSNMIRNARQAIVATGQPGEISVAARSDEADWVITVTDTGPGLPPKAREHLFQAFQGGVRKGGSGLGLAIVMELIRGHGGTVKLARSDEGGTCFEIRLPMGGVG
ncbi:sensor histidine kinase [Mameliella sediminis]|uniref:sensor histidine kinase n=1 Tax=Mameliella sediminis TaxID=2836866 RepID=UPI001C465534|nr:HAMP domain-containing histidine kinase [Mameliella sediminis]MBY6113613.1 HAMP domain-containing histidine kinase [Antarctobacter heliothermus]MBY6143039.1 HAMP domain-containing histidine kinase [Mameliella alba]MBY6159894.1 HAMP domain-containing histidine kinase [Mameliella alba]MBY6168365.1 HAMP domain-containing histidine kinase [Mameliella alba]